MYKKKEEVSTDVWQPGTFKSWVKREEPKRNQMEEPNIINTKEKE